MTLLILKILNYQLHKIISRKSGIEVNFFLSTNNEFN